MSRRFRRTALAATCLAFNVSTASADSWILNYKLDVGPDVRWWTGASPTAVNGLQVLTNYAGDLKYVRDNAFIASFGISSGYLYAQAKQLNIAPFPLLGKIPQLYAANGPLDVLTTARLDLTTSPIFQPYIWAGYNFSPQPTLSQRDVFSFASDANRDMRSNFGAGNFFTTRVGTIVNLSKEAALEVSWSHNFGTEYGAYDYTFNERKRGGDDRVSARLDYDNNNVTASVGYQRTWFLQDRSTTGLITSTSTIPLVFTERWLYGPLNIINARGEYRFDDHWFAYAEGNYSWQEPNARSPNLGFTRITDPILVTEAHNANPVKYSAIVGIGYSASPWTFQVQGIASVDEQNEMNPLDPIERGEFLPTVTRKGVEGIVSWKISNTDFLRARVAYLHVTGFAGVPGPEPGASFFPPAYQPADIMTVYLSGNFKFTDVSKKAPPLLITKAPVAVTSFNWAGGYIGANLGYYWSRSATDTSFSDEGGVIANTLGVPVAALATADNTLKANGITGGPQVGYNWQRDKWVWGVEADFQFAGQAVDASIVCPAANCGTGHPLVVALNQKLDWYGTLRGRVGIAPMPSILTYATGGLAYGEIRSQGSITSIGKDLNIPGIGISPGPTTVDFFKVNKPAVGWTVGAGVEAQVIGNWTVRAEYLHIDFSPIDYFGTTSFFVGTPIGLGNNFTNAKASFHSHLTMDIVRGGFNYKFN